MNVEFWKDMFEHDFDSTHSQYGIMDINKKMHGFGDQEKLSTREQTMKLVEEKYANEKESLLPDIQLFMAENLKEDITRPLACTNTSKICDGILTFFATYQEDHNVVSIQLVLSFIELFLTLGRDSSLYCDSFLHAVVQ